MVYLKDENLIAQEKILIGGRKAARKTFGFDEISLVPGKVTLDLELCDTSFILGKHKFDFPIIASSMDSVVGPETAVLINKLGGLAVLNLQGIYTRYENYTEVLKKILSVDNENFVPLMQELYTEPVKDYLIEERIKEIKSKGVVCAVSSTPNVANDFGVIAQNAGADIFVVQSTVVSVEHKSQDKSACFDLREFIQKMKIPVIVGNCVTYEVALEHMRAGTSAVLVGIGPGAACTSRGVLGIGVPMATSIADCAGARDDYFLKTGRYVHVIGDGGMSTGGDICKAIACGADAVMIGSPFAKAKEAPGGGYHWGMATPSPVLPRGTRIKVGSIGTLKEILLGPARFDDGTQNLIGALKTSMSTLGAQNIKEMQQVEAVIAPSILTEGKVFQKAQKLGMGK
ncbi:MAG: inosine 5-monophosphate dehydrogenase [Candidatus Melainabacteria bacterium RIFCSPLOWO2_02_FULL_35_15]|nr:MAG: inosine 5-monophosphate dehydrogenase [Candidatus Melainabacteria bacterium RIFCSPLOWO2_12_FULL_35_11]OGI13322.1 MAG: inosine 5-monophosphate dehydrogenase [Candidatus Melainabacteria bacterium RIFCSPLOWO2_02_FULL_35_15]